jgi:hypothetical protein
MSGPTSNGMALKTQDHCLRLLKSFFICLKTSRKYINTSLNFLSKVKTELKCQ